MLMFIAHIIEFLFWLVIGFSFLHTFLTHFILWVELRLLSLQPDSKSTIPWQALAKSFVIEFLCLIVYCITFPFRYWEFQTKIPATDIKAPPILLIHGYLHHQVAWFWFIRLLRKKQPVGLSRPLIYTTPKIVAISLFSKIRSLNASINFLAVS